MELYFKKERDKDFFAVCESIRKEHGTTYISSENIVKKAIYHEAESFYLNTKVYSRIINKIRCGALDKMRNPIKKIMYLEIWKRYLHIKRENPSFSMTDCARVISAQPAPRFYMNEKSALNLYYDLIKAKHT
ncbi:MAG: hypothetical protein LBS79_07895 [Tannerella sp.]|jgi:hypothetical protein|nr:hypothetical protein [Tannerella sp.]